MKLFNPPYKRKPKIHICNGGTKQCLKNYIKTRGKAQKVCLNCMKVLNPYVYEATNPYTPPELLEENAN